MPQSRDLGDKERLAQEAKWVQQALQGDPEALEKLYESYVDNIYSYFWSRVKNKTDAEALTSDVFTRAIEALLRGKYKWQGIPFGAWLFSLARHILQERERARQRQSSVSLEDLNDSQLLIETKEDILDVILAQETHNTLWGLVRDLLLIEQRILIFRHIYDLSYAEIAKRLGRTEGACKQLHYRALQKLKAKMQEPEK